MPLIDIRQKMCTFIIYVVTIIGSFEIGYKLEARLCWTVIFIPELIEQILILHCQFYAIKYLSVLMFRILIDILIAERMCGA